MSFNPERQRQKDVKSKSPFIGIITVTFIILIFVLLTVINFKSSAAFVLGILLVATFWLVIQIIKYGFRPHHFILLITLALLLCFGLFFYHNLVARTPIPSLISPQSPTILNLVNVKIKDYTVKIKPLDDSLTDFQVLEEATLSFKPIFEPLRKKKYRSQLAKHLLQRIEVERPVRNHLEKYLPEFMSRYFTKSNWNYKIKKDLNFCNIETQDEILEIMDKDIPIMLFFDEAHSTISNSIAIREVSWLPLINLNVDFDEKTKAEIVLESFPRGAFLFIDGDGKKEEFPYLGNKSEIKISMDRLEPVKFSYIAPPWYFISPLISFFEDFVSKGPVGIPLFLGLSLSALLGTIYMDEIKEKIKNNLPFVGKEKSS